MARLASLMWGAEDLAGDLGVAALAGGGLAVVDGNMVVAPHLRQRARAAIQAGFPEARVAVALGNVAEAVMAGAMKRLGRIDMLVNSTAGNDLPRLLFRTPPVEIPVILERCLFAQILSCASALPFMRATGGGTFINIASDAGKIPTPGESVIDAAMAGIFMFTRALALEGKRDGIRANVLTPSMTSGTEHYDKVMADPFAGGLFAKAEKTAALGVVSKEELRRQQRVSSAAWGGRETGNKRSGCASLGSESVPHPAPADACFGHSEPAESFAFRSPARRLRCQACSGQFTFGASRYVGCSTDARLWIDYTGHIEVKYSITRHRRRYEALAHAHR